ncbi:MAG: AbrB/MazE/SpoVT family DNA-binding domain-containing protein [Desulfobacteraceae bacterium]
MALKTSRMTSKGQIVVPKELRDKYRLGPASVVRWVEKDQGILLIPETEDPIRSARGLLKGSGVLKAYLKQKQRDKKLESKTYKSY